MLTVPASGVYELEWTSWPIPDTLHFPPNHPHGHFPGGRPAPPGVGVQTCERCGYRGEFVRRGDHWSCPLCVAAFEVERDWTELMIEKALLTVGRNEPCPCGSGRKAKKCHL